MYILCIYWLNIQYTRCNGYKRCNSNYLEKVHNWCTMPILQNLYAQRSFAARSWMRGFTYCSATSTEVRHELKCDKLPRSTVSHFSTLLGLKCDNNCCATEKFRWFTLLYFYEYQSCNYSSVGIKIVIEYQYIIHHLDTNNCSNTLLNSPINCSHCICSCRW